MEDAKASSSNPVKCPHKRKRAPLSVTEKLMVLNVFKYIFKEEESKLDKLILEKPNMRECAEKTASILEISPGTVFRVLKDFKENETPTPPQRCGRKPKFKDKKATDNK